MRNSAFEIRIIYWSSDVCSSDLWLFLQACSRVRQSRELSGRQTHPADVGVDGVGDLHRTGLRATEHADRAWGPFPQGGCALLRVRGGCAVVRGQVVPGPDHEHAHPRWWIRSGAHDATDRRVILAGAGAGGVPGTTARPKRIPPARAPI